MNRFSKITSLHKIAADKEVVTAYHGSNVPIHVFDPSMGAQGVMWFHEDKDKILNGESGAISSKYIMEVELSVGRTAGWGEYDKLYLQQIQEQGFDSIYLDGNWVIFDPNNVMVIKIEKQ